MTPMTTTTTTTRILNKRRLAVALPLCVALCLWAVAVPIEAYRYTVFVDASRTWTPPVNATNIVVSLWGGGGGGSSTSYCGASGGSGAAIINRSVGDACWLVAPQDVEFTITVGQGGAGWTQGVAGVAGNGKPTIVSGRLANGTQLFYAVAYGGGGAKSVSKFDGARCQGGGGGGAASSAVGPVPGGGNPPGAADNNLLGLSAEGAMIDDVKAGGAGAGYGFIDGVPQWPYTKGADWHSPGRNWTGGQGGYSVACAFWGGAAGFNGNGGPGQYAAAPEAAPPNSGSGGGSATACATTPEKIGEDGAGASGGAIIEYDLPYGPSPSPTPSPSATPSITPSPSSIPAVSTFGLVWPPTGKYLSCAWGGAVSASATAYGAGEVWYAERAADGTYLVQCNDINRYLTAQGDGTFTADQIVPIATNFYSIERTLGGLWIVKGTYYGKYIHANAAGDVFAGDEPATWLKV
ncbi:Fascin-like protein [Pandoravirus quercus]|uniref:Fascin-like protein n=1 Tax=Pandoravirus quercus TaxID=2107709 RepID=A0A2U7U7Z9_9VIRU|nr:Fascin-like protein [Pandoravirus quercus]AVK74553.1 Fascin-like protein [Pandoravirus quercus]